MALFNVCMNNESQESVMRHTECITRSFQTVIFSNTGGQCWKPCTESTKFSQKKNLLLH